MRFTAEISCFESTFENDGLQPLGHQLSPRHFESEDVEATVSIKSNPRRSISMPPRSRKVSSKKSMSRISEEEMLELYKMSFGGGGARKEEQKREEEELRKKMTRKPSRKVSRQGDYLIVQERLGVLMSQTGAQQVKESRYLINSDEYNCVCKDLGLLPVR